jgi:hypothetical protein
MSFSNEIADVEGLKKAFDGLDGSLNKNATDLLKLIKVYEDLNKISQSCEKTTENLGKTQKATADAAKQKDTIDKQIIATTEKLTAVENGSIKPLLEKKIALQAATKAQMDEIKAEGLAETSLVRMRQKLSELTAQYDKSGVRTKEAAKEIDALSREIGKAEAATNRHQRGVGGYADQLGKLPGPIGGAISGFKALIVQMWALVANPIGAVIAAIVGALALLFKAFSKSDEFMNIINGGFKAMSNVLDVLSDRLMSFFKMMGSIFTLDWEGMRKNGKAAFDGIGQSIKDAALSGYNYIQVMDNIEDREAASLIRAAKLRAEIEELKNVSKDQTKTSKERSEAAQLAYSKEIELFKLEKQFAGEKTDAEKNNLASKIQNNALSLKDKQNQLTKWLQFDDTEINSAQEKDAAFREFYDKNEAEFKNVQKMMADEIMQRAGFNQETRRLLSQLSGFKKELNEEAEKNRIEQFDLGNKKEIEKINEKHIAGITSEEEYQKELLDNDVVYLNKKLTLYKKDTKEYQDILLLIQEKSIKSQDDILKAIADRFKQQKELEEQGTKDLEDLLKDQRTVEEKAADEVIKEGEKQADRKLKIDEKLVDDRLKIEENLQQAKEDLISDGMNAIFNFNAMRLEKELDALDKEKEAKLSNKKLTEAQKAKIEEEYDKKSAAIKRKQAVNDKLQAMFNIALNTGMGVMNALSKVITAPLVPFIIAMGAIQLAMAAAQPIPKFAKGTKDAPLRGIFGEAGVEVMFPKGGGAIFADKPTYFSGDKFKGAQIYSNPETKKMMSLVGDRNIIVKNSHDDRIIEGLEKLNKTIQNKPVAIYDDSHRQIGLGDSHHQTIYLDRLLRNKS